MALYYRLGSSTMYVFSMPPHLVGLLQHFHSCFFVKVLKIFFFWSGLTKASQQQLAQHDQSVSSPLLSCCGVGIEKKNRILSFLQKYQYANYVISKMCIERIPASNTEQRRVLSISLIFDIPNTKNIPKTDDGRERFSFSSQILLCWQLLLRCVFWNAAAAAVQHIHKPYKARGGQFYGFIRGAVFYLHGLKIHGA